MTKKKKIILSIVAVVLALVTYGYFFWFQTFFIVLNQMFLRRPQLNSVPKPMVVGISSEPVTTIKAFDYSFSVPWSDCSQKSATTSEMFWACAGSNVWVVCSAPIEGMCNSLLSEKNQYRQKMIEWLGAGDVVSTNFYVYKKMLAITPKDVSLFDSKPDVLMTSMLLVLKAISLAPIWTNAPEIYSFEHGDIKGVQFGAPSVDRCAQLTIFDRMDRQTVLMIFDPTNSPVPLTQADINTIITTFSSKP